ncbi:MAG: polysaccharide biosynthesis C-terminal domain-containing protein [Deltaproteobacteria bacterium]
MPAPWLSRHAGTGVFPPGFEAATRALQILLVVVPLQPVAGHYRTALVALGRQRHDLGVVSAGAIVRVAAKLVLIPLAGISGAAWGTLTGEAAVMLPAVFVARTPVRASQWSESPARAP